MRKEVYRKRKNGFCSEQVRCKMIFDVLVQSASLDICICAYVYLCVCVFVLICICAYVYLCVCVWTLYLP